MLLKTTNHFWKLSIPFPSCLAVKAIAEKRDGKNHKTIFSFERSGERDWGHRWRERGKVETAKKKSLIGLAQSFFFFWVCGQGLNSIALPSLLPNLLPSSETCQNFNFFNFFSVTFHRKYVRKLGRKIGRKLDRKLGSAIELSPRNLAILSHMGQALPSIASL